MDLRKRLKREFLGIGIVVIIGKNMEILSLIVRWGSCSLGIRMVSRRDIIKHLKMKTQVPDWRHWVSLTMPLLLIAREERNQRLKGARSRRLLRSMIGPRGKIASLLSSWTGPRGSNPTKTARDLNQESQYLGYRLLGRLGSNLPSQPHVQTVSDHFSCQINQKYEIWNNPR